MKIQRASILRNILHPILALGLTMSAFALDDRFDEPHPQDDPKPKPEVDRPDLVPLGISFTFDHADDGKDAWRYWAAKVTLANFGPADAGSFNAHIGFKVLSTTDPVKWPVGSCHYGNQGPIYLQSLKMFEIVDVPSYQWGSPDFAMPKAVTSAEIFLVVDRWRYLNPDYDWENDYGADYTGAVMEGNEDNNVISCAVMHFAELLDPTTTEPVVVKPTLKLRGK
ncbi:hypothetical protein [Roseimicrobium sp. ORNL1]|uniref:hypothetical protein n=1 Tax=Roseimicrobium sp. ORNL1 TaxID=2711231 RepID=UPI0013E13BA7|nr:hypothetical protein [Roseimicrobium sp. ORNL1]QIF01165.1 hypothetical protein G5S37_06405 [Roseimicrobium sp. ORNL1]